MRWSDTVTLISQARRAGQQTDASGFPLPPIEMRRVIFADKKSVGGNEYLRAYAVDIDAVLLFDVRSAEYNGETLLEHEGKRYRVYKTYVKGSGEITELKEKNRGIGK
jgi:hypothetical protein